MNLEKQVDITDEILSQIEAIAGVTLAAEDVAVYEAVAASTRPLNKAGSLYDGARMTRGMLQAMADQVNAGERTVPLHTMHMQGVEIPVGKVFQARVTDDFDGSANLNLMFYLPKEEEELISKIDLGILDEVSVGVKAEKALCSKCGFDYMGDEADFTHLFSQTCENGHTIGVDGTHLKLDGVDRFYELSLVSIGASDKPKILSRAKRLVPEEEYDRMAASGKPLEAVALFSSATAMETEEMAEKVTTEEETQEFDAQAAIEALTASIPGMIAEALEAQAEAEEAEEIEGPSVEDLQAELSAANAKIETLEAAAVVEEEVEEENIELPTGGVAASAVGDAKGKVVSNRAAAFKTKR